MNHKWYLISLLLFPLFNLYSCSLGGNKGRIDLMDIIQSETPDYFVVGNIYKELDMTCFKGFVDKMTLNELYDAYGEPDSILDANDVAMIDGYDIYEYFFEDGSIDCYVKKDVNNDNAVIDYLYFEPHNNISLSNFVLNDSICYSIPNKKSVVYYIVDEFDNVVRFRLNNENKSQIVNIALNDKSFIKSEVNNLYKWVKDVDERLPMPFGDFGTINNMSFENKELTLTIIVNEKEYEDQKVDLQYIVDSNPDWPLILTKKIFGEPGLLWRMTNDMIRERAALVLCLYGNVSDNRVYKQIDPKEFEMIVTNDMSNIEILYDFMSFDNLTLPVRINDELKLGKQKLEDNMLVLSFYLTCEGGVYKADTSAASVIKKHEISLLSDKENPDREYISLCAKCNYGLKKMYYIENMENLVEVIYTPEEIKKLLLKL